MPPFAEHGHLSAGVAFLQIAPAQRDHFTHPQAAGIEQAEQGVIARLGLEREQAPNRRLTHNTLGERVLDLRQAQRGTDIKGGVADAMGKAEQGLHGAELAGLAGDGQAEGGELISERLHVAERDQRQGLGDGGQELDDIGAVSRLGVGAVAVEPEREQLIIGIGLAGEGNRVAEH